MNKVLTKNVDIESVHVYTNKCCSQIHAEVEIQKIFKKITLKTLNQNN